MNTENKISASLPRLLLGIGVLLLTLWSVLRLKNAEALSEYLFSPPTFSLLFAVLIAWVVMNGPLRKKNLLLWYKGLGRGLLLMGAVGSIIGIMKVMNSLDRPEVIGPGLVVALVAMVLGSLAGLVTLAYAENFNDSGVASDYSSDMLIPISTFLILMCSTFIILFVLKKECFGTCQIEENPQSSEATTPDTHHDH